MRRPKLCFNVQYSAGIDGYCPDIFHTSSMSKLKDSNRKLEDSLISNIILSIIASYPVPAQL